MKKGMRLVGWALAVSCLLVVVVGDHHRGEAEGEGERHRHHHHHKHGEGEAETGHDHTDHGGGKRGPWFCESKYRYLKVDGNHFTIGKKRHRQDDVIATFTLDSLIERNAAGNPVIGSGVTGVYHSHKFDFSTISETKGDVTWGEVDRYDRYQGLSVCHITALYMMSKQYDIHATVDFYFFKGEGTIYDGRKGHQQYYEVTPGSVKVKIQIKKWRWCTLHQQNCVIKERHMKTYDVGSYLDFRLSAAAPYTPIQCPDDETLWYLGAGAYMILPHLVKEDPKGDPAEWVLQPDGYPVFNYPGIQAQLPVFRDYLEWGPVLTFAEPNSGWRPGGPVVPPPTNPTVSSSSAGGSPPVITFSSSAGGVAVVASSAGTNNPVVLSSSAAASPQQSSSAPTAVVMSSSAAAGSQSPPTPPDAPCVGSLCGDTGLPNMMSSSGDGSDGTQAADPQDDPNFNPWPSKPSSSTGGAGPSGSTGGAGNTGGGAASSTGGSGSGVQDCTVGEWSDWMPCDVSCGIGSQTRTRDVVQMPSVGGAVCPVVFQIRGCDPVPPDCSAQDCLVSDWTYWTICSGPCGAQNRSRIVTQYNSSDGLPCPYVFESRACRQLECDTTVPQAGGNNNPPSGDGTAPTVQSFEFSPDSGNGWWIVLVVLAWIGVILGINEYITRLWERPKFNVPAAPAEVEQLVN